MAYAATPHAFTFANIELVGQITAFSGRVPRRHVIHEFPKRPAAIVEDMARGPRTLEVRLSFVGVDAAKDYGNFEQYVDDNPVGTLIHPIAGKWTAFCTGPSHSVEFSKATNLIEVTVAFIESELDGQVTADVPDVATASTNATGFLAQVQQTVAKYMATMGKAQTTVTSALNAIENAVSNAALAAAGGVLAPVDIVAGAVNTALGVSSTITTQIAFVQAATRALVLDVSNLLNQVSIVFAGTGDTTVPGSLGTTGTLVSTVQGDGVALETALLTLGAAATPSRPAAAADAVGDVAIMVDYCMTLNDAVKAAAPPTKTYVVTETINLMVLSARLIDSLGMSRQALDLASTIIGLNRIPNPAAIPVGTVLLIPTR